MIKGAAMHLLFLLKEGEFYNMDVHFNSFKVTYETLNKFMRPVRDSQYVKSMNIFINLDDFFHKLHQPLINNEFQLAGDGASKQFISNIFNLIAHYRWWGISSMRCDNVKVYAFFTSSSKNFKNSIYIPDYRNHFIEINATANAANHFVNTAIKSSLEILKVISNYIPNVYCIDTKYLEPSVLPLYIQNEVNSADWNILISRDTYDLQYAYRDKWFVIPPKGDNTIVVNQTGLWNYINIKERVNRMEELHYPYQLYLISKAIVGDKYRSIPKLRRIGWKTLFKCLDELISKFPDASDTILIDELVKMMKGKNILDAQMRNNLYTTNIELQIETMISVDRAMIDSQLMDIIDYENLKTLNQKYNQFNKYPINLKFLCDEFVSNKKKIKTPFDV